MPSIPPWYKLPERPRFVPISSASNASVVIVGCGLAGCHVAFELATRGIKVILVDSNDTIAGGASGNSAGIVKPFVTRSADFTDQFYHTAFQFLLHRLDSNELLRKAAMFTQCGVLQLLEREYPFNNAYTTCSADEASVLAGVQINSPAIYFEHAGWLNPAALCQSLVQHRNIELRLQHRVYSIKRNNEGLLVEFENVAGVKTEALAHNRISCNTLILANGTSMNRFNHTVDLPIIAARGQTSRFTITGDTTLKTVVTGKHYAIPDGKSVVVGASFTRDTEDTQLLATEHEENLAGLNTFLPSLNVAPQALSGFCAIRATTPDRLPVVGPMPTFSNYPRDYARLKDGLPEHRFPNASYEQGLYIIGGFGSRGIVSTPYCAKLLTDFLCGSTDQSEPIREENVDNLSHWSALIHPGRFTVRDLKRAGNLTQPKKRTTT